MNHEYFDVQITSYFTFESVALLNEILSSFLVREDLLDSSIGKGFNLPISPITSHTAPTNRGLVSSSNVTENINTIIKQNIYALR